MAETLSQRLTIRLKVVPRNDVDTVLSLWKGLAQNDLASFSDRAKKLSRKNLLRRFVIQNRSPHPLRSVLSSVRARWGAVVLREYPYLDHEFWDSHAGLYARCFKEYSAECWRLHFFSNEKCRSEPTGYDEDFAKRLCRMLKDGCTWPEIQDRCDGNPSYYSTTDYLNMYE